jgi:hypothetical protein
MDAFGVPTVGGAGNNCRGFTVALFCIQRDGTPIGRPLPDCIQDVPGITPPLSAYSIRSGHAERDGTHLCLAYDSHDGKLKKAACDQNPNKSLFVDEERSDACYSIRVQMPGPPAGRCLDNPSRHALEGGNRMQVLRCNDTNYQHWKFVYLPDSGGYYIINKANGFCLDYRNHGQGIGAVEQYICDGSEWQVWYLDPKP